MSEIKTLPFDVGRYTIRLAKQTGGKAGKSHNKTSTIQVFYKRYSLVVKSFRFDTDFTTDGLLSKEKAIKKAIQFAKKEIEKSSLPF